MNIREWTLPVYTILTQLSTGALLFIMIIRLLRRKTLSQEDIDYSTQIPILIIFITVILAIGFAHLHLSKPFLSFTALRNLATSWLSRELFFNLIYILLIGALSGALWFYKGHFTLKTILGWLAILAGFGTEYCMARIYMIPSQPAWNTFLTPLSFFFTTLILGVMTVPVLMMMDLIFKKSLSLEKTSIHIRQVTSSLNWLSILAIIFSICMSILIFYQTAILFGGSPAAQTSLLLLTEIYKPLFILRLLLMFIGTGWLGITSIQYYRGKILVENLLTHVFTACLLVLVAEILGRFLFYAIHVKVGI
ncbi:MAG TPA: DmsC/YnfH family molybdoenzyme membrane anchor subunit [Anaerolineales bacterium]|nr:DmsC/YnfH family molybdoenzyme membrane anchor subunit [Anaerolineales bacterium]